MRLDRVAELVAGGIVGALLLSGCATGPAAEDLTLTGVTCAQLPTLSESDRAILMASTDVATVYSFTSTGASASPTWEYFDEACADPAASDRTLSDLQFASDVLSAPCDDYLELEPDVQLSWASVLFTRYAAELAPTPVSDAGGLDEKIRTTCANGTTLTAVVVQQDEFAPSGERPSDSGLPLTTYTAVYRTDDGYQQTVTLTVTPVILGTDAETIVDGWRQVGGADSPPCYNVIPNAPGNTTFDLPSQFAGYAFGTISVQNDVLDFPVQDWPYTFTGYPRDKAAMGVDFGNGPRCDEMSAGMRFTPKWTGNDSWGPVPFAIAVAGYRSPATPNGDAAVLADNPIGVTAYPATSDPFLQFVLEPMQ